MGIESHAAKFLLRCAKSGVRFDRTLTLGRQHLFLSPQSLRELFAKYFPIPNDFDSSIGQGLPYVDGLLGLLGATTLTSLDASPYEGASAIHDMNTPLESAAESIRGLRGQFSAVIDGGTLEHVFNFPNAIKNAMELVEVGGHLLLLTPANNFLGHGFYQFSPELFYRVLSPENGFVVERMIALEYYHGSQWYEVSDPAAVRSRVQLIADRHRIMLFVKARRVQEKEIFRTFPQQSDYQTAWNNDSGVPADKSKIDGHVGSRDCVQRPLTTISRTLRKALKKSLGSFGRAIGDRLRSHADIRDNRFLCVEAQPQYFRPVSD